MKLPTNVDEWTWIYAFFRATIQLNGHKATQAANLITGEERPEPDEDSVIAKLKPIMAEIHQEVGCEKCRPNAARN